MLDVVVKMNRLPKSGEDAYMDSQEMAVGGCAYNVADILKHFDVPYTLFAPVGTGVYASIIEQELDKRGHTSPIRAKQDNGYCMCIVEADGERTFLTLAGVECKFEKEWFALINANDYDAVYVCGYEVEGDGGEHIIEFLENHPELTVYYAPGPRITYIPSEKHKRIMAIHPILHLNEKEAMDFTGKAGVKEAAQILFAENQNTVIITCGAEGVYLQEKEACQIATTKVEAFDTIGAGDSHIGSIIAMRQIGLEMKEAIQVANQVSALVVGVPGPTLTKEEFLNGSINHKILLQNPEVNNTI
jgi:sugar/nucleoside kinase (ribokinase family)